MLRTQQRMKLTTRRHCTEPQNIHDLSCKYLAQHEQEGFQMLILSLVMQALQLVVHDFVPLTLLSAARDCCKGHDTIHRLSKQHWRWLPLPDAKVEPAASVAAELLDSSSAELVYNLGTRYGKRLSC